MPIYTTNGGVSFPSGPLAPPSTPGTSPAPQTTTGTTTGPSTGNIFTDVLSKAASNAMSNTVAGMTGGLTLERIVAVLLGLICIGMGLMLFRPVRDTVVTTAKTAVKAGAV